MLGCSCIHWSYTYAGAQQTYMLVLLLVIFLVSTIAVFSICSIGSNTEWFRQQHQQQQQQRLLWAIQSCLHRLSSSSRFRSGIHTILSRTRAHMHTHTHELWIARATSFSSLRDDSTAFTLTIYAVCLLLPLFFVYYAVFFRSFAFSPLFHHLTLRFRFYIPSTWASIVITLLSLLHTHTHCIHCTDMVFPFSDVCVCVCARALIIRLLSTHCRHNPYANGTVCVRPKRWRCLRMAFRIWLYHSELRIYLSRCWTNVTGAKKKISIDCYGICICFSRYCYYSLLSVYTIQNARARVCVCAFECFIALRSSYISRIASHHLHLSLFVEFELYIFTLFVSVIVWRWRFDSGWRIHFFPILSLPWLSAYLVVYSVWNFRQCCMLSFGYNLHGALWWTVAGWNANLLTHTAKPLQN